MAAVASQQAEPAHNLSKSAKAEAAGEANGISPDSLFIPRGDVTVTLNYFIPPEDGTIPFSYVEKAPEGQPQFNFGTETHSVTIHDIRGHEEDYDLDKDAFKVISNLPESTEKAFATDESIKEHYYPELEKLLLEHVPGSTRVVFFDYTKRRADPTSNRNPVQRVHIDQTLKSAKQRVELHLGSEAEKLLQGRFRIINVWRPLNGPVNSYPLAFSSSSVVDEADIVPVEHRYPDRTGQTAGVKFNEGQKWHYWSGMRNDERLLLECFDSEALKEGSEVKGGRVPHTAFKDPRTPAGAPGRESIEVRTLVFGP